MKTTTLSAEDRKKRLNRITASTVAAVLGYSQWETPFSAWLDITGQSEREENMDMALGIALEPVLIRYAVESLDYTDHIQPGTMLLTGFPWMAATPDALCPKEKVGVEVKNRNDHMRQFFKGSPEDAEFGNDLIPVADNMQCQWGMLATGYDEWVFCVYFGGRDFRIYRIRRDVDLLGAMIEAAHDWWKQHVDPDGPREMPEVDGREPTRKALTKHFGSPDKDKIAATEGHREKARRIRELDNRVKEYTEERARLVNTLAVDIGPHIGIEGVCSYPLVTPKPSTDWKGLAQSFSDWPKREAQHKKDRGAYRRFQLLKGVE